MNQPLVSIIVPTFNDGPTLETCIRSLFAQTWSNLEVIVINDSSTDGTLERLHKLSEEFLYLRYDSTVQKRGPGWARNLGFDMAQGEVIALIDGDMWAPPEWVEQLVEPILQDRVDVTGGPDKVPATSPLESRCIGYSMDSVLTNGGLRLGDSKLVTYLPGTGNMAIRRSMLEQAGQFDVAFHDTGEDKEWLHRVKASGGRFAYLPHALAWHERKPDILLHAKKQILSGRRRFDIWEKDPASFEFPHLAPSLLILFLLTAVWIPQLRWAWWLVLAVGAGLVFLDCWKGARELGDPRAFFLLIFTSCIIPFGYGFGILWRALERLLQTLFGLKQP